MAVTLEPCPHCGALLTPALVAAIKNPNMEESCPRRPKTRSALLTTIAEAPKIVAAMDAFNDRLGRAAEKILRLLDATEPKERTR